MFCAFAVDVRPVSNFWPGNYDRSIDLHFLGCRRSRSTTGNCILQRKTHSIRAISARVHQREHLEDKNKRKTRRWKDNERLSADRDRTCAEHNSFMCGLNLFDMTANTNSSGGPWTLPISFSLLSFALRFGRNEINRSVNETALLSMNLTADSWSDRNASALLRCRRYLSHWICFTKFDQKLLRKISNLRMPTVRMEQADAMREKNKRESPKNIWKKLTKRLSIYARSSYQNIC